MAIRRVLNFALDVTSFFFESWRLVIHRLGAPGKGELKGISHNFIISFCSELGGGGTRFFWEINGNTLSRGLYGQGKSG